jgi:putative serine protease PepD
VIPGSPADAAGLQENDVITAVGGRAVDTGHDLVILLLPHRPGEVVALTVNRGGEELEIEITLGTLPPR